MKAAVLHSVGADLVIEDRPVPTPGTRDVIVHVEASGLCHTDLQIAKGIWPAPPRLPVVLGHEVVGKISAVGTEVTQLERGDYVAVPWLWRACGHCDLCLNGAEALCSQRLNTGYDVDGGFADYVRAPAAFVVPVPHRLDLLDAACLTCAGAAAYRAVKASGAGISDVVAVFGIGGVGHFAVQYASAAGASVVAVDTVADKVAMAAELGAGRVVNAAVDEPTAALDRLGGADCALVTTDAPAAMDQALASLRPGGRLVLVAVPPLPATLQLPVYDAVRKGLSVVGSVGANRADIAAVFALHVARRTRAVHQARALHQVNRAMAELEDQKVRGQLVFELR